MIIDSVGRRGDDGKGHLLVMTDDDGDVHVGVSVDDHDGQRGASHFVEFCTLLGGGRSSKRTLRALRELREAIRQDNANDPLAASPLQ